jgi:hypothetical protein
MTRTALLRWLGSATSLLLVAAGSLNAQLAGMAAVRLGVPVAVGPFELSANGSIDQIASPTRPRTAYSFDARLSAPFRSGGAWIGSGIEGARDIDTIPVRPLLRLGVWQNYRAIRVSVGASTHAARVGARRWVVTKNDSTFGDSSGSRLALWSELESRLSWRVHRVSLGAVASVRPQVERFRPTVWGHVEADYALSSYASLVGAVGSDAPRIALGIPAVHFASVAMRIGPWTSRESIELAPSAFVVRSVGERRYSITYQAANASSVELSGDFDGWKPTPLKSVRAGVWEATIVAPPGTYHVNLRVDGGNWFAPPGLAHTEDDFSGAVGILVLR